MVFQSDGDGVPFFFLHNDWKGGFYCGRLASHIGGTNPFCAVPPYRSTGQRMVSLQEMASEHLNVIRQRVPQGPYFLGGYCTGGLVAAEMARQLLEQGEKICGLLLIDPPRAALPWRQLWPLIDRAGDVLKWTLRKKIDCMQFYGLAAVVVWFRKSPSAMIASACRRLGLKKLSKLLMAEPERHDSDAEIFKREDYAAYVLASRIYQFKRISVPTTIYVPDGRTPPSRSWTRRMSEMFPSVSFKTIPGNHLTCLTEHGGVLGAQMKETLDILSRVPTSGSAAIHNRR
jgi:thioesterase domain-containing protein